MPFCSISCYKGHRQTLLSDQIYVLKDKESHKNEVTNAHLCSESGVNSSEVPWEFVAELAFL